MITRFPGHFVAIAAAAVAGAIVPALAAGLSVTSVELTPYRTCVLSGYTPTSPPTTTEVDSYVAQASATSNFGTATSLSVQTGSSANRRAYLSFNLSSCPRAIPSSAVVRQGTLRLYTSALPAACRTYDIFRVTSAWTESGIKWTNQPFGTTLNNPASGSRSASFTAGTAAGCQVLVPGYASATVTSDVQSFVNGSQTNFGWMIRDDAENGATTYASTYSSNNLNSVTQSPQLIVTYVDVP